VAILTPVCNAGRQQSKPSILDITTEEFDATMKTNIYGSSGRPAAAVSLTPISSRSVARARERRERTGEERIAIEALCAADYFGSEN
jgi:NAD(P)-dependent dehydrogenase (short-subunit alcohol dehydrogenase family)